MSVERQTTVGYVFERETLQIVNVDIVLVYVSGILNRIEDDSTE